MDIEELKKPIEKMMLDIKLALWKKFQKDTKKAFDDIKRRSERDGKSKGLLQ